MHEPVDVLSKILGLPLGCAQRWVDVVWVYKERRFRSRWKQTVGEKELAGCRGGGGQGSDHPVNDVDAVGREWAAIPSRAVELDDKEGISMGI